MIKTFKIEAEQANIEIDFEAISISVEIENIAFNPVMIEFFNGSYRLNGGEKRQFEIKIDKINLCFLEKSNIILLVVLN